MTRSHTAKKILVFQLFIILNFFLGNEAKAQMRQVYRDSAESNEILKLSFYSPSEGFAAFSNWIGYTTDSGRTFTKKYITLANVNFNGYQVNVTFGFEIKGAKAFNQNELIVYGSYGLVPSILYSNNGGNSYKLVFHSQFNQLQLRTGITDMIFPENNNIGYATDADRILKTNDKGVSWTVIRSTPGAFFTNLEAVDNNTIFVLNTAYASNSLQKTSNGGASWTSVSTGFVSTGKMSYAYFLNANTGWMSVYDNLNRLYFYKTINGGNNWTLQNNVAATPFNCYKLKFIDENTGYALAGQNQVFKTFNSGITWEPLARNNQYAYLGYTHNDLQCLSVNQVWAGGGHGFLELNTNANNSSIPKGYFNIDTTGLGPSVNLINFSRTGYSYQWFVNNVSISTSYNATYTHDIYTAIDTIKLIVSNGIYSDTTIKIQYFDAATYPAPVINSFTPVTGSTGTNVTITGRYFSNVQSVSFGGIPASSFTVISLTTITAIVGAGANGAVVVTTPSGTGLLTGFITVPPPVVSSFSPTSGPIGSVVTITGYNFSTIPDENIVYIGRIKATVNSATSTRLSVTVPAAGSYLPISVTVNNLTAYSRLPFVITFPATCNFTDYTFSKTSEFVLPRSATDYTTADFNNDGKPDIAVAVNSGVIVLKNISTADISQFESGILMDISTTSQLPSMSIADFDGDNKPDIALTNANTRSISIFQNTSTAGAISFGPKIDFASGVNPTNIVADDLDKDGKPDIALINRVTNNDTITLLRNISLNGSINFSPRKFFKATHPRLLLSGDMDGDGKNDLVIPTLPSSLLGDDIRGFLVYKNTSGIGDITFASKIDIPYASGVSNSIKIGDIDGDGKPDVISTSDQMHYTDQTGDITVYRNTSSADSISFAATKLSVCITHREVALGDLDGDNKIDLYTYCSGSGSGSYVSLIKNTSTPGNVSMLLISSASTVGVGTQNLDIADINGDGRQDLVMVSEGQSKIFVRLNTLDIHGTWAGRDTTLCLGQQVVLGNPVTAGYNSTAYQYVWTSLPSGFNSSLANPNVSPLVTTTYYVTVTNPQGCTTYDSVKITVGGPAPAATNLPASYRGCVGDTIHINNPASGTNTYSWQSQPAGFSSSLPDPVITPPLGGAVYILTINTGYCVAKDTLIASIYSPPAANAGSDRIICPGQFVIGSSGSSYDTYQWTSSDSSFTGSTSYTTITANYTSSYYLKVTNIFSGCIARDTVLITVINRPIANAGPDRTICGSDSLTIGTSGDSTLSYSWRNATAQFSTLAQPKVRPAATATYYLTVRNIACAALDTIKVNVFPGIPSLSIAASDTSTCPGNIVQFNASATNGNSSLVYQWKKNGLNTGTTSTTYTSNTIQHQDTVWAVLSGDIGCTEPTIVNSNKIVIRIENTWIGGPSNTQWELPSNWSCGTVPGINTNVLIKNGTVNINSNAFCRTIRVLTGAIVTVTPGYSLTVIR